MSIFDRWTDLDPALARRRIEAAHGSAIFNQFSGLDPYYAIRQTEVALGIDLDNRATDFNQLKPAIDAALAHGGAPSWVPVGAKIHFDFLGGAPQGRAWNNGAEVAISTLLTGAVLDAGGLLFIGAEGASVTATPILIAAAPLPYSGVFDQTYNDGNTLSGAETMAFDGIDSNHKGTVGGSEVSLTTDDYDVLYLAADPAPPSQDTAGKLAFTLSNAKAAVSVNGATTTSDASQTLSFGAVTGMRIWTSRFGGQLAGPGHIRSITFYPVKSDSELSALSR
jgi:hypothetical protein